ncbi:hypothetical protein M406DRAFT_332568 [Cryphonectria parasitica EP155]|uniref:Uncharacterized protein n=1 Tax=Cryphonectria parasitica (strain ATCC 38755 / EP155) TaxID=660469 RepID=A0A9P4XWG9_CRYP1|nr:uncharacterized protein M406DRAFT_332568 [Cryphonectria parasitica EP155]KAF3762181.1 hypothetical protein M406DRAFT_332568 [Cryphonectria parasitica EP155]
MLARHHSLFSILASAATGALAKPFHTGRSTDSGSTFSSIVVFGDSFSDNGNGSYRISNGTWPLVPPYYQGHFSNGPVWPQYLASNLSIPLYDYATGGATTSNSLIQGYTGPESTIPVPAVTDQLSSFLSGVSPQGTSLNASSSSSSSSSSPGGDFTTPLFVVWAGANDIFFNPNISAAQSYLEIAAATASLLAAYPAGHVLTVASPDLSRLPYGFYADELTRSQLTSFTDLLAALLADGARLSAGVDHVDLRALFASFEYYGQPQSYGFAPLEGAPGANGTYTQCDHVQDMVYWDEYQKQGDSSKLKCTK